MKLWIKPRMKGRWYVLLLLIIGAAIFLGLRACRSQAMVPVSAGASASAVELPVYEDSTLNVRAPDSVRIRVEVLNATTISGHARKATYFLRDRGFDVVYIDNSSTKHDSTIVIDRTNHPAWAQLIATAMSGALRTEPDSSRYVDVTVLVGKDWAPPPEPFYP